MKISILWLVSILFTIVFTILKFTGAITWPWLAVLSPILAWLVAAFLLLLVIAILWLVTFFLKD